MSIFSTSVFDLSEERSRPPAAARCGTGTLQQSRRMKSTRASCASQMIPRSELSDSSTVYSIADVVTFDEY